MKKGFTLIELLAVIVILAIIALIATPIILGIINDAKEESNERSVELYASAVRNAIAAYQLTGTSAPKSFSDLTIEYDGDVKCTVQELYEDGSFYLEGCKVNNGEKEYSYGTKKIVPVCVLNDKDADGKISLSDVVTCGTESFYVMYNENSKITMLSMFNLNVGNVYDMVDFSSTPISDPTGIQDEFSKGGFDSPGLFIGVTTFSEYTGYWVNEAEELLVEYGDSYPANVFDSNSYMYNYVSGYENYLKTQGVVDATAILMTLEQATKIGCSLSQGTCSSAPYWVSSTSYWTGIAKDANSVYTIFNGGFVSGTTNDINFGMGEFHGVRPVITMPTSNIK